MDHTIHLGRRESHNLNFGNHFSTKPCFWRTPDLLKTSPRPSREPVLESWVQIWIRGPKNDPRGPKPKRCAPKNHAEPRLQNSKWSHMVKIVAQNHFGLWSSKPYSTRGQGAQMGHRWNTRHIWNLAFFSPLPVWVAFFVSFIPKIGIPSPLAPLVDPSWPLAWHPWEETSRSLTSPCMQR